MPLDDTGTLLELFGMGVPLYSARNLSQTLTPIASAVDLRRDCDGVLIDLSFSGFRKYASRITCTDMSAPALDGIWPGQELTVHCVAELIYPVSGMPQRQEVSGSSYTVGDFVHYRPVLVMMVTGFSNQEDEWPADSQ